MKRYSIQKQPAILQLKKNIAMKLKRHKKFQMHLSDMPYWWTGLIKIGDFDLVVHWRNFIRLKDVNYILIRQRLLYYGKGKELTKTQLNELNELLR